MNSQFYSVYIHDTAKHLKFYKITTVTSVYKQLINKYLKGYKKI